MWEHTETHSPWECVIVDAGKKREPMAATIKDVAKLAGVSTATVSYVVNGTQHVSDETRRRVLSAVEELEYRPSALARSLRIQRTRTIGLILPQLSNMSYTVAAHGIEEVLQENGYSLIISESDENPKTEEKLIRVFDSLLVDGLIVVPSGQRQSRLREVIRGKYPTIFLDRRPTCAEGDMVLLDNYRATNEAVSHLIASGHERIGMILGAKHFSTTRDRIRGYKAALRSADIDFDPELVRNGGFGVESGLRFCEELLSLTPRPTALFMASANMTLGAFTKVREMGLSIPDDVALIGCGDLPWATATIPPLSMIFQPLAAMGKLTAELLLKRIDNPGEELKTIYVPAELRLRDSV